MLNARQAYAAHGAAELIASTLRRPNRPRAWPPDASRGALDCAAQRVDDLVDVLTLDDQRRRQRDDVAGGAQKHAFVEAVEEDVERALGRLTGDRLQLDAAHQTEVANVDHV